jgi:hypothetical protein
MKSVKKAKPIWKDDFISFKTKCYHGNLQVLWRTADPDRVIPNQSVSKWANEKKNFQIFKKLRPGVYLLEN